MHPGFCLFRSTETAPLRVTNDFLYSNLSTLPQNHMKCDITVHLGLCFWGTEVSKCPSASLNTN